MKEVKLGIAAIVTIATNSAFANDYNVNVIFDDFEVSNDDKLIYGNAIAESDYLPGLIYNEDHTRALSNSIEKQVATEICKNDKFKQLLNLKKYLAEIEITLDTGEKYMIISMNECR